MNTDLTRTVDEAVRDSAGELLDLLTELIAIPTETPVGENYGRIVDRLTQPWRALGFEVERIDLPDEVVAERCRAHHPEMTATRANLLATRRVPGRPAMLWYTHLDTVPAGPRELWDTDPFTAVQRDGMVYGRGASDSKGGTAALLTAFRVLDRLGVTPAVSPVVALTTDEEIGPYTGLMYLADQGFLDGVRAFHSCDGTATNLGVGYCGTFAWSVTVRGHSVHSGLSFLGRNPVEEATGPLLEEILATKEVVQRRRSAMPSQWPRPAGREHVGPLLNVNQAKAGVQHNVVPETMVLGGDRRIIPEESYDDAVAELSEAVDRAAKHCPGLDFSLAIRPVYRDAWTVPVDDRFVRSVGRIASEVRGEDVPVGGSAGSSDVSYVANKLGVPTVSHSVARPGESNYHSPNERVRIADLLDLTRIICRVALTEDHT